MKNRIVGLGLLAVALLFALIPASVGAQSPNTYTSIIVTDIISGAPVVGGTFVTDVQVSISNSATPKVGVMGAELWIPFDSTIVNVDDFDDNPANGTQVEIRDGFFDGNLIVGANEVIVGAMPPTAPADCGAAGACVHVAVSHTGGSGPITDKKGSIARITWAGVITGTPNISVAIVPPGVLPGSILSDGNGQPIPINSVTVPSITVIDAGQVVGTVKRQGSQTNHANTQITAIAVGDGVSATGSTGGAGNFSVAVPKGSTYSINASYPGYLQSQKESVYVVGSSVNIGTTTLVGGDVNGDSCINILDIVSVIGKFGTTGLPKSDSEDINDDGTINILDLTIAANNFNRCGPTAWVP